MDYSTKSIYMPPKFQDAHGNIYEGEKAWEEGLKKASDKGILVIPNRPFSGKPIKLVMGNNPLDGDYRKPLTESELELLLKAVPGLSIRVVDSMPELTDPKLELFLREYYNMGDLRISNLTWSNIFEACRNYLAKQKAAQKNRNNHEIDSRTKEQTWRDDAPEYIPNSDAVKMSNGKISIHNLSKHLRKSNNTIRWMRNKATRRSKVHVQDFMEYIASLKSVDQFSEEAFKQQARQKEIDAQKERTGK